MEKFWNQNSPNLKAVQDFSPFFPGKIQEVQDYQHKKLEILYFFFSNENSEFQVNSLHIPEYGVEIIPASQTSQTKTCLSYPAC